MINVLWHFQLQNLLEELQRQLDLRRGNYGSSLTSAEMIAKAFQSFLILANAVEGRMHDFMTTADRVVRDKHYDSRRIRHEVDETDRRWKTFYNSIKNYETALADSTNFFKSWEEVRDSNVTTERPTFAGAPIPSSTKMKKKKVKTVFDFE